MKISLLQEGLAKGVGVVGRVVATKAQLPVLANILLSTDQGKLKLTATNLETGINLWLGGKIEEEGKISVPARIFSETINALPPGTVSLSTEEERLKIVCGKFKAEINGISAEEFPEVPTLKDQKEKIETLVLDRKILEEGVGQVAVAAATDESRPVFTGIKMELEENTLRLAATDGYRLSIKSIGKLKGIKKKKEMVVPARALSELVRVLGAAETEAKEIIFAATSEEKQLILSFGEGEVVTRILEGEFPDFDKIVPKTHTTSVSLETEELFQAVKATAVFAKDSANIVKFKITESGLVISANTPQVGGNEVEVEGKVLGENAEVAFNSRYLIDVLNVIGAKELTLQVSGPLNPGVFIPAGETGFLHIIMPVRVQA